MVQSFNLEAALVFPYVRFFDKSLAMPHYSVKDINSLNLDALQKSGYKGLVFDKDNTITAPYINQIHPQIEKMFEQLLSIYSKNIVIMSNSAGTNDDKDYQDAKQIERDLGIKVIRHSKKKPGGFDQVEDYFECTRDRLIMVGDRIFTDVVFGNLNDMLTIHTTLLTEEGDNQAAAKIRKYELPLVQKWYRKGIRAPPQTFNTRAMCIENLLAE